MTKDETNSSHCPSRFKAGPVFRYWNFVIRHSFEASRFRSSILIALLTVIFSANINAQSTAPSTQPSNPVSNDDANRNIVLPTEPGDHKLKFRTHIGKRFVEMSYLLHLPPNYADTSKTHPMLVFFHGVGECGTDLAGIYALGPMTLLRKDDGNPTFAASCPFIVLCPQCPPRGQTWDVEYMYKACVELIAQTIRKTRTDADRVYATGLSMGGLGTWCVAEQGPDLFAAIAPLSAMGWHPEKARQLLKYVSVWCVVGNQDQARFLDGTHAMDEALSKGPLSQRFTYFVNNGHDAWWPPYQNPQFYEWLLSHRRPSAAEKKKFDARSSPPTTQSLPTAPGHYLLTFPTKIGDQPYELDYSLYIPRGYKPSGPARPAMLFLHEQNTIGPDFHNICMHGPDLLLERNPALQNNFPFVVISPRLPVKCDWATDGLTPALLALVDHVSQGVRIDPDRISLTGIDNGAAGVWKLATDAPDRFCALAPIILDQSMLPVDNRQYVIDHVPGREFFKPSDDGAMGRIRELLRETKMDWQLVTVDEKSSPLGDVPVYGNGPFLAWLGQQNRKTVRVSSASK